MWFVTSLEAIAWQTQTDMDTGQTCCIDKEVNALKIGLETTV